MLMKVLAEQIGCGPEKIMDFELALADTQPGVGRRFSLCGSAGFIAFTKFMRMRE